MQEPTGNFSIVDSIDQILSTDDIATRKNMRFAIILHSVAVDIDFSLGVEHEVGDGGLVVFGTEGADDVVSFYV